MLKPFPDAKKYEFKEKFIERYSKLTDWEVYKKYSLSFLRKSIRVNTLKTTVAEVHKRLSKEWMLDKVPWCEEGFWISHKQGRLDVGNTIEHSLGYYYVQEAASMIPPIVLNPLPGDLVLDMCAAPGSKTTQIAQYMKNKGLLIANDIKGDRLASLGVNLQRCGVMNEIVTMTSGERIKGILFDKVLLDAPCSGTGTIRKSPKTIRMWNPESIKRLSKLQKKLIIHAFSLLKKDGVMVYSTCSNEPEENEGVVDYLLKEEKTAKLEEIKLDIKRGKIITSFGSQEYDKEVENCLRLWPQDNDTEGFFVARVRKV